MCANFKIFIIRAWNVTKKARFYSSKKLIFCSIFCLIFYAKFFKKKCFSSKLFGILLFRKSQYAAIINSQVKFFFFFFWNLLSNNIKNVNLKYQNLKEVEHFYFIQSQQNFTSFFWKLFTQNFWNRAPFLFLKLRSYFFLLQIHANCWKLIQNWFKIEKKWKFLCWFLSFFSWKFSNFFWFFPIFFLPWYGAFSTRIMRKMKKIDRVDPMIFE